MADSASCAGSDRNRENAGLGFTNTLERPRNLEEEEKQREAERCQRDEERRVQREESRRRRKKREEREERDEREEEEQREEEREGEEVRRRQADSELQRQHEEDMVAVIMAWVLARLHAAAETRDGVTNRKRLYWPRHAASSWREKTFRRKYRMDEPAFNKLVEILRPVIERDEKKARLRTKSGVISVETRLAIALRFCAGASYLDMLDIHGVSRTACYSIFHQVVDAIIKCSSQIGAMEFPTKPEELEKLAAEFQFKSDGGVISGCIGCADGLNVKTEAPSLTDVLNVIRYFSGAKGCYSLNVQAIATAKYRFLCMSCKAPGSAHDWTAYTASAMSGAVDALPDGYYILGDAAYPLSDKLLTPYPGKGLAPQYDSFNFHLSQLRVKVEQSFGILVQRWGILWRPLRNAFDRRPKLIRALFHLHNFCIDEGSALISLSQEKQKAQRKRPTPDGDGCLPAVFRTAKPKRPRRSGEVETRRSIMLNLQRLGQGRPEHNTRRNMPR